MFASVYIDGASVAVFVGRVTAVDATTITVSTTAKSGTAPTTNANARTIKVGGAWKGPNAAEAFPFGFAAAAMTNAAGDTPRVNIKGGVNYAITAQMTHNVTGPVRFQGYTTTSGDGGRAAIDGGTTGASFILLSNTGANNDFVDLIFQNNGDSGTSAGYSSSGSGNEAALHRCVFNNVRGSGAAIGTASCRISECEAYSCNQSNTSGLGGFTGAASGGVFVRCISHDNAGGNSSGFSFSSGCTMISCIAESNGGDGFVDGSGTGISLLNCDSYGNAGDGIELSNSAACLQVIENCNLVKNGGYGINGSGAGSRNGYVINCGFGSGTQQNTSGTTTGLKSMVESGSVTYPADVTPWVDPANGDFRIVLGQAKGTGRGTYTQTASSYAGTVGYPDIGAAQHYDQRQRFF